MPHVHPFNAIQFNSPTADVSNLISPPYDVLDAKSKAALLAKSDHNIVAIDLPHTPAKELGPSETYQHAGSTFRQWLNEGTLKRRQAPAIFAYRQTYQYAGLTRQRCGMACTMDLLPFGPRAGGGVLPHEETFSGPKEDRMALMKATQAQLSPIFGLHQDASASASKLIHALMAERPPDNTARTQDSVKHELWTIDSPQTIAAYQTALTNEDIFIADGHHRYNTALSYLAWRNEQQAVPPDHPARRIMMVLVSMSDPGLLIGPTHRVLGGMSNYSLDSFQAAAASTLRLEPVSGDLHALHRALTAVHAIGQPRVGLYDFATKRGLIATPVNPDPLAARFPDKPKAWRTLDVAFTQYTIVEDLCQTKLGNPPVKWAFPHSVEEVLDIGQGTETGAGGGKGFTPQLAVILRPTPLESVREVSRANVLMPQKSTFFYPKLATGLFVHDVE